MSMVKLIESCSLDPAIGAGAELVFRQGEMSKQASTIFGMDYSDMKPDDRHVGIHVVALGDEEHYGPNRNADSFDKQACVKYHDTFVKHGHVFRHHRNKDPEKAIGIVKASAYNEPMGRIELFIHADKEKAAPELARLEKEGEIPFSMAALVPFDVCSLCGSMRKSAGDESECDHVANSLGETMDDGRKVFTRNTEPKFFDISFVGKPADRIAWNLTKAASSGFVDSVKLAEYEGVVPPDDLAVEPGAAMRKLGYARGIAELQSLYTGWLSKKASVSTMRYRYLRGFTKVSASSIDEDTVGRMREMPVRDMLSKLASCGVMMDVPTFFRYAMGSEMYGKHVAPVVHDVEDAVPRVLASRVKSASMSSICNDATYDTYHDLSLARVSDRVSGMLSKVASTMADPRAAVLDASMAGAEPKYLDIQADKCLNGGVVEKLAEAYLSYQLSAIDAVVNGRRSRGADDGALELEALAAAGNLQAR